MSRRPGFTQPHFLRSWVDRLGARFKRKSGAGFTLIELLVTIGMAGIIAAFSVPAYGAMKDSVALTATTRQLVSTIREAQNKSITSQDNAQFGVKFNGMDYTLFRINPAPTPGTLDLRTVSTDTPINPSNPEIVFSRLTGHCTQSHTVTIGDGPMKTITVSANGLVTVL